MAAVAPLPGDADNNGHVDLADFGALKSHFGLAGDWSAGDFSADGRIDINDFGILKDNFGRTWPGVVVDPVPEPAGWMLAIAGMATLLALRRPPSLPTY